MFSEVSSCASGLLPKLGPRGRGAAVTLGAAAEAVATVAEEDLRLADAPMRAASHFKRFPEVPRAVCAPSLAFLSTHTYYWYQDAFTAV